MSGVQMGGEGLKDTGDEFSANGDDGERLLSKLSPTYSLFYWHFEKIVGGLTHIYYLAGV